MKYIRKMCKEACLQLVKPLLF
jgi:hypothetical protein